MKHVNASLEVTDQEMELIETACRSRRCTIEELIDQCLVPFAASVARRQIEDAYHARNERLNMRNQSVGISLEEARRAARKLGTKVKVVTLEPKN